MFSLYFPGLFYLARRRNTVQCQLRAGPGTMLPLRQIANCDVDCTDLLAFKSKAVKLFQSNCQDINFIDPGADVCEERCL